MTALVYGCQPYSSGNGGAPTWRYEGRRARYTNTTDSPVLLDALGLKLAQGCTVEVGWAPGDTSYHVSVQKAGRNGRHSRAGRNSA